MSVSTLSSWIGLFDLLVGAQGTVFFQVFSLGGCILCLGGFFGTPSGLLYPIAWGYLLFSRLFPWLVGPCFVLAALAEFDLPSMASMDYTSILLLINIVHHRLFIDC